jgi:hypothetical protein
MAASGQQHEFTLWRSGRWRCEFWIVGEAGHLRVYYGERLERELVVTDAAASCARASEWRTAVERAGTLPPE